MASFRLDGKMHGNFLGGFSQVYNLINLYSNIVLANYQNLKNKIIFKNSDTSTLFEFVLPTCPIHKNMKLGDCVLFVTINSSKLKPSAKKCMSTPS
jgi:hypothetical protein